MGRALVHEQRRLASIVQSHLAQSEDDALKALLDRFNVEVEFNRKGLRPLRKPDSAAA